MTDLGKKIYFFSDFHLGTPNYETSLAREKRIVAFLEEIKDKASHIFILGDLFDFWYEYKKVVPKGYVRILGKLAELTDKGVIIKFFVGNHDMWMNGYFEQELNIEVLYEAKEFDFNGKKFFVGHGDGLGPGDHRYKFLKKVFRNKLSQFAFGALHPGAGIDLANYMSHRSKIAKGTSSARFLGEDKEWLIIFAKQMLEKKHYDYFIFGHRHFPIDFKLPGNSRYINLGDWINHDSYAVFDGNDIELKYYTA